MARLVKLSKPSAAERQQTIFISGEHESKKLYDCVQYKVHNQGTNEHVQDVKTDLQGRNPDGSFSEEYD